MIKVVLDTNIYVSAIVFGGKPREVFLEITRGKRALFVSKKILAELRGVLRKKFKYTLLEIDRVEQIILEIAEIIEPRQTITIIPSQPMDNHILECAVETKADFVITGDKKHLLLLKKFKNIPIISADQFLKIFQSM